MKTLITLLIGAALATGCAVEKPSTYHHRTEVKPHKKVHSSHGLLYSKEQKRWIRKTTNP